MNKFLFSFLFLLLMFSGFPKAYSQEWELSGEVNLRAAVSSGEELPFWMYHNQRGRLSGDSNLGGWISGKATYTFYEGDTLQFGGGLLYHDGIADKVFIDELYAFYQNHWMSVSLGRKQREELYNGLSSSNRSILMSLNSRPLPGFEIRSREPLFGPSGYGLGFDLAWGEYLLGEDRQVEKARLHHKSFHLVYRSSGNLQLKAGLQHYAQWGGETDQRQQRDSFQDYLRTVAGGGEAGEASGPSDQASAIANHLMGWEFFLNKKFDKFEIEAFYQHLLEDGSGRLMRNFPDGRYGLFIKFHDEEKLVNSVMYEFYTTSNQSTDVNGLYDNYFNHGFYTSGWTYENRVLGSPFFSAGPEGGVVNNQFSMHHLGLGGQFGNYFRSYPYKLLLSYGRNDGTYKKRYRPHRNVFYFLYEMELLEGFVDLSVQGGGEFNSWYSPKYGIGLHLRMEL